MEYLFAGLGAFLASVFSAIAGGGGGLIINPFLLLLGFNAQTVLTTIKAGGLGLNLGASSKFIKAGN